MALAGGLQGVGEGLSQDAAERREMRGVALREKYLMARQQAGQAHQAGMLDKRIDASAAEGAANREHAEGMLGTRIDASAAEGAANRDNAAGMLDKRIDASAAEGAANRELRSSEGAANRELRSSEGDKNRAARESEALARAGARIAQLQSRDTDLATMAADAELVGKLGPLYPQIDPETGEPTLDPATGEPVADRELINDVIRIYQAQGQMPREIKPNAREIVALAQSWEMDVDQAVERIRLLDFKAPSKGAITRAGNLLNIDLTDRDSADQMLMR